MTVRKYNVVRIYHAISYRFSYHVPLPAVYLQVRIPSKQSTLLSWPHWVTVAEETTMSLGFKMQISSCFFVTFKVLRTRMVFCIVTFFFQNLTSCQMNVYLVKHHCGLREMITLNQTNATT